jgi:hypothetical protein
MNTDKVALSLKRFLLVNQFPADWKSLDLYLFRDESIVFYVGQSYQAFARVWEHLMAGFHGHSLVGRFVWANWPASMNFTIELLSSQSAQFDGVGNELSAAERLLIQQFTPCFNLALNAQPHPIPGYYRPVNAPLRCGHSLNKLYHEAERAVKAEERKLWLEALKNEA